MPIKDVIGISLFLVLAETGAIWDSTARVWKTTGASRGLPTTPGNCLPPQPSSYPTSNIMFERQYQLRQGPGTYMMAYTTMMDCFNACYSNSSCVSMWFAGYNLSCTHYSVSITWRNYNQTVQNNEYVYTKRYSALISDPRLYTVVNPLIPIRQQLSFGTLVTTFNTTASAGGATVLCVTWRPARKCNLQPYMIGAGTGLQPYFGRTSAFFLSTEKTSDCGSFMSIYERNAGNGNYYYSNTKASALWNELPGIYSWDPSLC